MSFWGCFSTSKKAKNQLSEAIKRARLKSTKSDAPSEILDISGHFLTPSSRPKSEDRITVKKSGRKIPKGGTGA
ncbi:MAG: hypothetical protein A2669_01040 [Candidatus Yanofskybacteria bacterium RIFCSPHIGHO2_01_FULL_48_25b]|uniref:Uncharacterized protein n=1 Tax=Candidatus Yanofskybacteria bacterium RIFCSPHIGHO2_01_FULL_48_25b TaxID=1802672 RepID=A0A1F8F086_9BACT|nr:MAG: hypothetical protein A2669_01040 [Candidatus Yanofskybacteria bacterium RIFCSPHIGHO2_01_FULL_48_25b]